MKQLPTQVQFDDVTIIRKEMTLEMSDLQEPTVIPPGPAGSLRAYTVTNGDVITTGEHAPSYTRTMTHMCPAALATPLLTPGPGGATLLVTTFLITPVAREPGGKAGTSIYVVSGQRASERLVIVQLQVDTVAQSVVVTPVGGEPWAIKHGKIARLKDDGNGKLCLTFKAGDMPEVARRPWKGWPLAWTEWLRRTHSANPTIMLHAPPGKEKDTGMAACIYGPLIAGGARPVPVLHNPIGPKVAPVAAPGGKNDPRSSEAPAPPKKPSKQKGAAAQRPPKP